MSIIYLPFSYIMKACVWLAQNSYLFGLLFFALVFQLILFPLAIKQQKSQISMAKIRPKELAIREKYAGRTDRVTQQKMQQEIQEMHQQEGYSPLSGCLPLLIQLPLIFILYAIVRYPVQYSSNFTDAAQNEILTTVTEEHEGFSESEGFAAAFAQYAFDYAENIREHLVPGNEAAEEADRILTGKLGKLGELETPEGDDAVKEYANGMQIYTLNRDSNNTYRELGAADIVGNYGEAYIETLRAKGALDDSFDAARYPLFLTADGERQYYADMMPNFTFLKINLLLTPSFEGNNTWQDWILLLIPLLVFLTSFLNTKITRHYQPAQTGADGNPMGNGLFMTVGMPLMSAVFSLMFPAAIGAYWVWRTLLSMVQPVILHKLYPIPVFTEEELEAAKRELKSKQKQKKKKVITIEVDEDDDSYAELEVKEGSRVESARPKREPGKAERAELPYRKPTHIEMLSADEEDGQDEPKGDA